MLSSIKNSVLSSLRKNNSQKDSIEIEVRFGSFKKGRFESNVPPVFYFNLINDLREKGLEEIIENSTVSYFENKIRKIEVNSDEGKTTWERKVSLEKIDLPSYEIRFSMSSESPLSNKEIDMIDGDSPSFVRERIRHTFIDDIVKYDITEVMNNTESSTLTTYEIEVEFLEKLDRDNFAQFENKIEEAFKIICGSNEVYTKEEKEGVNITFNGIFDRNASRFRIDKNLLVRPRNIKRDDLVSGGIINNKKGKYTVTFKADGKRKILVFNNVGIWLVNPPYEYNLVFRTENITNPNFLKTVKVLNSFIFDGELLKLKVPTAKYTFLVMDCIASKKDLRNNFFRERKSICDKVSTLFAQNNILQIMSKEVHYLDKNNFYDIINYMLDKRHDLPYNEDGLIFTPDFPPYCPIENTSLERILPLQPDVCKWKRVEDMTIDFAIKWNFDGKQKTLDLMVYDEISRKMVNFVGTPKDPFDNSMVVVDHPILNGLSTGRIVEFEWIQGLNKFSPRGLRNDKAGSNSKTVAIHDWKDISNPITEETMRGLGNNLMRDYHNRIKRELLSKIEDGSNLLDIGTGRGGDIGKWKKVNKVVAVEPNKNNYEEFLVRVSKTSMKDRVKLVPTGGGETEQITKVVKSFFGKADVVSLMLSASFFWSSVDHLESLIKTIIYNIKMGGTIILLTIDGDAVEELFEPVMKEDSYNSVSVAGCNLFLHPKPQDVNFGRVLDINIPNSIVGDQTEWLVKIDDFVSRLAGYGFELISWKPASKEDMLPFESKILSSLYSYGIIKQTREIELPNYEQKNIRSYSLNFEEESDEEEEESDEEDDEESDEEKFEECPDCGFEKEKIDIKVIPDKFDDRYESINSSWANNLVRFGTINSNSLCHAILKAFYPVYQNIRERKRREDIVNNFRHDLAIALNFENSATPGYPFYLTSGKGYFINKLVDELVDPNNIRRYKIDYSLAGLQSFYNSGMELGEESYEYISEIIDLDIYFAKITDDDVIITYSTASKNKDRKSIIIGYVEKDDIKKYETIGVDNGETFQTFFEPEDEIVYKMNAIKEKRILQNFNFKSFLRLKLMSLTEEKKKNVEKNIEQLDNEDEFVNIYREII